MHTDLLSNDGVGCLLTDTLQMPAATCSAEVFIDRQVQCAQELSQADKEEAGRVPRTLEVELTRDLVDSCSAGDVVTALGIVKVLSTDAEAGKSS